MLIQQEAICTGSLDSKNSERCSGTFLQPRWKTTRRGEGPGDKGAFQGGVSPRIQGELDAEAFRKILTPDVAAEALRQVADGAFPSVAWDSLYDRRRLYELLDETGTRGGKQDEHEG